jgi:hypothetical protein
MHQASSDLEARPRPLAHGLAFARGLATVSAVAWAVVAAGLVLRVVRFADNRPLWLDEAMLSLNIIERGFLGLLRPLDYLQAAPPAFLLLEKLAVVAFGPTEYALRLVPLLAAIAALIVFRQLSARVLPGLAGLVALGLFAVAEPLVYWSAEAKQYSVDVLAAVVLLHIASEPLLTGRLTARRASVLAAVGALAVFFSYASVFALSGIGAALILAPLLSRRRPSATAIAVSAFWILGFAAVFLFITATAADIRGALSLGEWNSGTLRVPRDAWRAFSHPAPFSRTTTGLAVLMASLGALSLARHRLPLLVALAGTFVAVAVAAQAQLYPFVGRFVLFLVPLVLLLVGAGIQELREATAGRTSAIWVAPLLLLAAYPVGIAGANLVNPPVIEETRDVLRALEERWHPGDSLFVAHRSQPVLAYYAECEACGALDGTPTEDLRGLVLSARSPGSEMGLQAGGRIYIADIDDRTPIATVASRLAPLRGQPRAWVLISSGWDHASVGYVLDCLGQRLDGFETRNAAAYLYDFSGPASLSPGCPGG